MKKSIMILLTCGLAQAIFCQKNISRQLDELMDAYTGFNKFNGSVLIARKGEILLEKGYGMKNTRDKTKNDVNSIFRIYSVTKTFTSTVILKLVELNKLALTDKLSKFYPSFPKGDSITIEQLLRHTSGIYDYTQGNDMPDQTEKSFISFLEKKQLNFSPGTRFSYSNSGYWLLGFIIGKVTGISYEEAVKKYVFIPLHMTNSGFDFKYLSDKNKATGYELLTEGTAKEAEVYDPPGPYAAGAIHSTVGDLFKYHEGLQSFKIINRQTLEKAYTPFMNQYGYGWMIGDYEGKKIVSHGGGGAGFTSNFLRIPGEDICIVLLENIENANPGMISGKILDVLHGKPYIVPSEIKLSRRVLESYTGTYEIKSPHLVMYITMENGRLAAQASGQLKTTLLAQKENYFFAEEANGFIEFKKDDSGKTDTIILQQGGGQFTGNRIYPVWGLVGSATSNGWSNTNDIPFTQDDSNKGLWIIYGISLKTGEIKFRFNKEWTINYGDNDNDGIPEQDGKNIKVEAGTYDILLDLSDKARPKYSIIKKQ